jgi:hypothetical protein
MTLFELVLATPFWSSGKFIMIESHCKEEQAYASGTESSNTLMVKGNSGINKRLPAR